MPKGKEDIEILTLVKKGWKKSVKKIGVTPKRTLFIPENRIHFFPKDYVGKEWTGYKNGIYWELLDIIIADKETAQNPRITMALRLFHECWHAMRGSQRIHEAIDEALTGIATKKFYRSVVCVHPFFAEEIRNVRKQKIKIDTTRTKEALCLWNALRSRTPNKKSAHSLLHNLFQWQITGSKQWLPEEIDRVELATIDKEIAQELRE